MDRLTAALDRARAEIVAARAACRCGAAAAHLHVPASAADMTEPPEELPRRGRGGASVAASSDDASVSDNSSATVAASAPPPAKRARLESAAVAAAASAPPAGRRARGGARSALAAAMFVIACVLIAPLGLVSFGGEGGAGPVGAAPARFQIGDAPQGVVGARSLTALVDTPAAAAPPACDAGAAAAPNASTRLLQRAMGVFAPVVCPARGAVRAPAAAAGATVAAPPMSAAPTAAAPPPPAPAALGSPGLRGRAAADALVRGGRDHGAKFAAVRDDRSLVLAGAAALERAATAAGRRAAAEAAAAAAAAGDGADAGAEDVLGELEDALRLYADAALEEYARSVAANLSAPAADARGGGREEEGGAGGAWRGASYVLCPDAIAVLARGNGARSNATTGGGGAAAARDVIIAEAHPRAEDSALARFMMLIVPSASFNGAGVGAATGWYEIACEILSVRAVEINA